MTEVTIRPEDLQTSRFDAADYLTDPERILSYLRVSAEEAESPADIALALGTVARARGLSALAEQTGMTRQSLHKALSAKGNPRLSTMFQLLEALGLRISFEAEQRAA